MQRRMDAAKQHCHTAGATHTRFDHSLGVAFKAWEIADQIWRTQHAELGVERADCKIVELAGKCS